MERRPRLVITLGDPCGIGAELLARSLCAINRWADVVVVGARAALDLLPSQGEHARVHWRWGAPPSLPFPLPDGSKGFGLWTSSTPSFQASAPNLLGHALWVDPTPEIQAGSLRLGENLSAGGRAAVEAVRVGAGLVMDGHGDALVTLPLSKAAAHLAGYDLPGHTEFLQQLSGTPITRMAFVSPRLSVVLHSVHQSLRSVLDELDQDAVAETLSFAADRFIQLTGKSDLRVALCALNPHAGEEGAFGDEEIALADAVTQAQASFLDFTFDEGSGPFAHVQSPFDPGPVPAGWEIFPVRNQGMPLLGGQQDMEVLRLGPEARPSSRPAPRFFGPFPADTLFHRAARGDFDLVVALYHDQGLIPIKLLEPSRAVNLTLGLPFIRTSPDHGTAFDIAGLWQADPANFLEAAALAVRLAGRAHRQIWEADPSSGNL
ncbi:MAG: 4-hydroxythreonine-4-phosphate dehydrogenase PdxA [Acidobacteria bacterium]|nr:4-hydroxythreonine-4-phosphate dehydrogenase PdxA [Acidobacteriota bacterium]